MNTITLYIGLDVHKDSITIAIAEAGSKSEIRLFGTITNDLHALEKALNRYVKGSPISNSAPFGGGKSGVGSYPRAQPCA